MHAQITFAQLGNKESNKVVIAEEGFFPTGRE
jgi:hypothetical protein